MPNRDAVCLPTSAYPIYNQLYYYYYYYCMDSVMQLYVALNAIYAPVALLVRRTSNAFRDVIRRLSVIML